jgi:hypothetical protein
MKRLLFLLVLVATTLPGLAQSTGEAFYIYRNDGQFNAFFRDEVEKMEYSNIDADGVEHDEMVTQLVYTADSVYSIPLAAIDSVGFIKPEVIYNPSVVKLDELLPYVVSVDDLSINFSNNMPTNLIPHLEDVLFFGRFEDPFPNGFAGIIKQIDQDGDIVVICEPASIEDIYDQLVDCQIFEMDVPAGSRMAAAGDYNPNREGLHIPIEADGVLRSHNVNFRGDMYVRVSGKFMPYRQLGQPTNIDISLTLENTCDIEVSIMEGVKFDHDFQDLITPLPIKLPYGFSANVTVKPFIELEIGEKLSAKYTFYDSQTFGAKYENGEFNTYRIPCHEFTGQDVSLQGRASFYGGLKGELKLCTVGNLAQVGGSIKAGFYAEGELGLGSTAIDNTDNYELSKNDKVTTSLRVSTELFAGLQAGPFAKFDAKLPLALRDFLKFDHYVLPLFEKPTYTRLDNKTDVEVTLPVNRDLLGEVEVGLTLYDEDDKLIETKYEERLYRVEADFIDEPIKLTFSNVDVDKTYIVYPIVRLFGENTSAYRATPKKLIGAPIKIEQTEAIGKCGGEVTFKAKASPKTSFEEEEEIVGRGYAIYYGDELMKELPIDMASPDQPVEFELVCHSDSLVEEWENFIASTESLWYITTYTEDAEGNRAYLADEMQELELIYDQKPAYEYTTIANVNREEEIEYFDDGRGHTASFPYYTYYVEYGDVYRKGTYWYKQRDGIFHSDFRGDMWATPMYYDLDQPHPNRYIKFSTVFGWYYSEDDGYYDFGYIMENIVEETIITLRNDEIIYANKATQINGIYGSQWPEIFLIDEYAGNPFSSRVSKKETTEDGKNYKYQMYKIVAN